MVDLAGLWRGAHRPMRLGLDRTIYILSTRVVPIFIALLSLLAIFSWQNHYAFEHGIPITYKISEQTEKQLSPADAVAKLLRQPSIASSDTKLSEAPFWIFLELLPEFDGVPVSVEFTSRHAVSTACWDRKDFSELGMSDRSKKVGAISPLKTGFVLSLGSLKEKKEIVCRSKFVGPARISVNLWKTSELMTSAREFERLSGLMDGGLLVLGLFVLITAAINRESTYVLFAAWLVINLRMGALSAGWDTQWLGHTIPNNLIFHVRAVTISLFILLTYALFRTLFLKELREVGYAKLLFGLQLISLPLLLFSIILPYHIFLPITWVAAGFATFFISLALLKILRHIHTAVVHLYAASMSITIVSSIYEVISAALGLKGWIGTVNSVTAALASSVLTALAIAVQMRRKHQQWVDAQAELQHTYEAMPIGLFTLDRNGKFLSSNPALLSMLGVDKVTPGVDSWDTYFPPSAWTRLRQMAATGADSELEIKKDDASGAESKRFLVKAILARDKIEGSLQDITARAKATEELRFMANNDPLTKVLNRRGLNFLMEGALQRLGQGAPLALGYLDLDRFKLINDLFGHAAGDDVLKQVCERIASLLTDGQKIGRIGGDEFVIVFPDTPISVATAICRDIVDYVAQKPYHTGEKAFQVRCSIGLIDVRPGTEIKDAISSADRACRDAKQRANDGLTVYEKDAPAFLEREAELRMVERFSASTAPEGLFLDMQPIMSLKNPHASLNFEVLLRMRNEDGSVVSAGAIIPAAESSGRIGIIDRWVLSTTLAWINTHFAALPNTQFICMNLSGASLNDERFVNDAFDMLEKNRRASSILCLEITESVALHDLTNTRRFIDRVRSYGVKIALDDFGAGYTSFTYLKDLPGDVLKIDGNFIVNMNAHPANIAIVEAIVNLAMNLGMKTIAEWAEDNETVQTLVEIGIDYVQGYAVSRPQTPEKILSAGSSAAFIQDPGLIAYVGALGKRPPLSIPR